MAPALLAVLTTGKLSAPGQSGRRDHRYPSAIRASAECLIFHLSGLSAGAEHFLKKPGQK
jgi:hypothetical protein